MMSCADEDAMPLSLAQSNSGVVAVVDLPPARVYEALEQILQSPEFKATPRRRRLLEYLVEELLAGREQALKGYTIATAVFDRDETFDPQTDPVVRLEARRLRHDLDGYYVSAGRADALRITIPKGQYAPVIEWQDGHPAVQTSASVPEVDSPGLVLPSPPIRPPGPRRPFLLSGLGALLLAAIATILFVTNLNARREAQVSQGPALAVLPFAAERGTSEAAFLGRGLADQIAVGLSRFSDFRLYLPAADAGDLTERDSVEVGNRLGLSYVLDGTISSSGDKNAGMIRISARLIDVKSRRILWIATYDRPYAAQALFALQDEIATSIAEALGQPYGIIKTDESISLRDRHEPSMTSYECVLRAYAYRKTFTRDGYEAAAACLEQATRRDPDYAEAWAMLGWLHMDAGRFGWAPDLIEAYARGLDAASHAASLDRNNVTALKALASIYHYMGEYKESERIQRRALALNPNDPDTLAQLGWRLAVRGRFDEGIPYLRQAIQRTVNPPGWYQHLVAIDHYLHGRYDEMLETAQNAALDGSGISWSLVAIAEGELGDSEAAARALERMAAASPFLARDPVAAYRRHQAVDSIVQPLVTGLRKAGWKEPAEATIN
jgi:TolB-like protein